MLKTFTKGGIHPQEHKISAEFAIIDANLSKTLIVPILQHIGIPAKILVERKQKVKTGQLIAKAGGFISSNIHAPATGIITKIDRFIDSSGYKNLSIAIRTSSDIWMDGIITSDEIIREINISKEEIIERISNAGIVGMGGATFPSHIKLTIPKNKKVNYLIINGVECEPYLTADHRLMLEKSIEIGIGIRIMQKALESKKVLIGIENNKKNAIKLFKELFKNDNDIEVLALKVKYPQGGEKQLIKAAINKEVPLGELPIECGVIVHNVGTVFSVYEAVQKNKPLIERIVTVTGLNVKKPGNFKVRIGTPIIDLIHEVGGIPVGNAKILNGGPMMGKAISDLKVPITKGTSGIVLMPEEITKRLSEGPCIRCARCIVVCPMGLEPYLLRKLIQKGQLMDAVQENMKDCIECGSCNYICPSSRALLDFIRLGKNTYSKIQNSDG